MVRQYLRKYISNTFGIAGIEYKRLRYHDYLQD